MYLLKTSPQLIAKHNQKVGVGVLHKNHEQHRTNTNPQRQALPWAQFALGLFGARCDIVHGAKFYAFYYAGKGLLRTMLVSLTGKLINAANTPSAMAMYHTML